MQKCSCPFSSVRETTCPQVASQLSPRGTCLAFAGKDKTLHKINSEVYFKGNMAPREQGQGSGCSRLIHGCLYIGVLYGKLFSHVSKSCAEGGVCKLIECLGIHSLA